MYIPYHMHTRYSVADGIANSSDYCKLANEYRIPAIAITDHGSCNGWMQHVLACKEYGIKPIIGTEAYVITDKEVPDYKNSMHAVILVLNASGYYNLLTLIKESCKYKWNKRMYIQLEDLIKYNDGLIITTACMGGLIGERYLRDIDPMPIITKLQEVYGDRLKGEIQPVYNDIQLYINNYVTNNFSDSNIWVATDSHYARKEDHNLQTIIKTALMNMHGYQNYYYMWSYKELVDYGLPIYALKNTMELLDLVTFELEVDVPKFPTVDIPDNETDYSHLCNIVYDGLEERIVIPNKDYYKRLDYELRVIRDNGTVPYFLVNYKIFKKLHEVGIFSGPRGSACGSLVAYCLYLHDIDPIRHEIMFERFMTPGRKSLPDIDYDFHTDDRERAFNIVGEMFGKDRVARIAALQTLKLKSTIQNIGKHLEIPSEDIKKLSKDAGEDDITSWATLDTSEFKYKSEAHEKWIDYCGGIADLEFPKGRSLHPAGIVIATDDIHKLWPVFEDTNGTVAIQYDMEDIEHAGGVKMDFLGLSSLHMIITLLRNVECHVCDIPDDDGSVYSFISHDTLTGLFQAKAHGMKQLIRDIKPNSLKDLAVAVAAFRPAVLKLKLDKAYIKRKHGNEEVSYPHKSLEPVLKDTYGIFLYQDHTLGTCKVIGMTDMEADKIRKYASKKKPEEMAKMRPLFEEKAKASGWNDSVINVVWDVFSSGASYNFNYSHALTYGRWLYITAYAKKYYPGLFYQASLTARQDASRTGDEGKLFMELLTDCQSHGIQILEPDINNPSNEFIYNGTTNTITYSLLAIKGMSEDAIRWIMKRYPFDSIDDLIYKFNNSKDISDYQPSIIKEYPFQVACNKKKVFNYIKTKGANIVDVVNIIGTIGHGITHELIKCMVYAKYKCGMNISHLEALAYAGALDKICDRRMALHRIYQERFTNKQLYGLFQAISSYTWSYQDNIFQSSLKADAKDWQDTCGLNSTQLDEKYVELCGFFPVNYGGDNYTEKDVDDYIVLKGKVTSVSEEKKSKNGNAYINIGLMTSGGSIMCCLFDNNRRYFGNAIKGELVTVKGRKAKNIYDASRRLLNAYCVEKGI